MKVINWIIVLGGLWEFADITALFVPGFGVIQPAVWNHILVGLVWIVAGTWAARTHQPRLARRLDWVAAAAGLWLVAATFILRGFSLTAGHWNDLIVGTAAFLLSAFAALSVRPAVR